MHMYSVHWAIAECLSVSHTPAAAHVS